VLVPLVLLWVLLTLVGKQIITTQELRYGKDTTLKKTVKTVYCALLQVRRLLGFKDNV